MRDSVRLEETGYASAVRGLLLVLGSCCAFLAQARTTYYLWQSESSKNYLAITNETYWSTTGKSTGTVPAAIDETGDFVVNGGKWLRSQASKVEAQTFTGHSLTITNGVLYNYDAAGTFTMTGEGGLTFWNGSLNVNRKSANSTTSIKSDVYIKGTNNFASSA